MDAEVKSILDSIKESTGAYGPKITALQQQLDAIDLKVQNPPRFAGGAENDVLEKAFQDSPEFARIKELGNGKATIKVKDLNSIQTKTTITSSTLGVGTAGVLMPELVGGGIVPLAQRRLFLRDLLFRGNHITSGNAFFIQELSFTNNASPQGTEGSLKSESANTFTTVTKPVTTLAHWIPVSRQALDDMPTLMQFIKNKLLFGLRYKEEVEILSGDGTGAHLTGLLTAAAAFSTSLLAGTSWNKADVLRRALQQVERNDEVPAGFFMLHPDDWAGIELLRNGFGDYIIGDPRNSATPTLWGRPVVVSTAMQSGYFLCGSSESAELIDRMDATIEISLDYADYRARNLAMILCENRTVLCIYRPNAFVYGALVGSPAS